MKELPHSDCSGDVRGNYKTLRITEAVLDGFMRGEIKRTPKPAFGEAFSKVSDAKAVSQTATPPKRGGKLRYDGPIPYRK